MTKDYENMSLFEQLKAGLEDSIAYSRGELNLKTTELPEPPPKVNAAEVARLRTGFKMSQAVLAAALNVSTKTVQSWEQGEREPSGIALRMLQIFKFEPKVFQVIFAKPGRTASRASSGSRATKRRSVARSARHSLSAKPARRTQSAVAHRVR